MLIKSYMHCVVHRKAELIIAHNKMKSGSAFCILARTERRHSPFGWTLPFGIVGAYGWNGIEQNKQTKCHQYHHHRAVAHTHTHWSVVTLILLALPTNFNTCTYAKAHLNIDQPPTTETDSVILCALVAMWTIRNMHCQCQSVESLARSLVVFAQQTRPLVNIT